MHHTVGRLREKHRTDEGFTLIELLVVVVIIGVLVAIAVPVYLNYRQGAADKSAQSDVRGTISAVEQFYTDNSNAYPKSFAQLNDGTPGKATFTLLKQDGSAAASVLKVTLSDQTDLRYVLVTTSTYKICAKNSGGNKYYLYDSSAGGSVSATTAVTAANFSTCG
jgi:type IV pilus assembly protein PilA